MQDRILWTAPRTINWQNLLCKAVVEFIGKAIEDEDNPPSLETIRAALEDAKYDVEALPDLTEEPAKETA